MAESDELTITQLAELTGVAEATLRAWEERHGMPCPQRLRNGHRRYSRADVELVQAAVEHRRAGLSVAASLKRGRSAVSPPAASIFAGVREVRPELIPQAIPDTGLRQITRAIEDEVSARAVPGLLIGAFQREAFYRRSETRWRDLAAGMEMTIVMADFSRRRERRRMPSEVPFPRRSPLQREWGLIASTGCLLGRERPTEPTREGDRVFDTIWSPEPDVAHSAAHVAIALLGGGLLAERATHVLGPAPAPSSPELRRAASLTNRMIGYLTL